MTAETCAPDTLVSDLPTPEELQKEIPMDAAQTAFIHQARDVIEAILNGWDSRLLLIMGPCSIHDTASALDYATRFKRLSEHVSSRLFLVMRTYFEKPRTIIGWKGMLYDPDLDGSYNLAKGMRLTRELLYRLTSMGVPAGCELLEINTSHYYSDFLSWGCIGARTCSSPPHRQLASSLSFPIGFKNSVDGNIDQAIHGIVAAATPHVYLGTSPSGNSARIQTEGNFCHIILRGGLQGPNYYPEVIHNTVSKCRQNQLCERVVVDCSHDNCGKKPEQQISVFESLIEQIVEKGAPIAGLMLESHLNEGSQDITLPLRYGVSITDPCLGWKATEELVLKAFNRIQG